MRFRAGTFGGVGAALAALALVGCAGTKVVYQPYEVRVPVAVPCAAPAPEAPDWATRGMPHVDPKTGTNLDIAVDKLVAEREQRRGYEDKLRAAVKGCQ